MAKVINIFECCSTHTFHYKLGDTCEVCNINIHTKTIRFNNSYDVTLCDNKDCEEYIKLIMC